MARPEIPKAEKAVSRDLAIREAESTDMGNDSDSLLRR